MGPGEATSQITREHIDAIRRKLLSLPCKTPDNQEIQLKFDIIGTTRLAQLIIKSGSRNALSGKMICQLTDKLDELYNWTTIRDDDQDQDQDQDSGWGWGGCGSGDMDARCLLIRGHNDTFSSGSDLVAVRETANQLDGWELAQIMQYNLARLEQLPLISVAFVQGYALGGGAELTLAADMRIMSKSGKIGFVHAKNGICCGWGGGARLIELIGRSKALEMLSSGRLVGQEDALQLGLSEGKAESLDEAIEWTLGHAIESRRACRAVKQLISCSSRMPFQSALQLEAQLIASTWGKEAHMHALNTNLKHKK